MPGVQVKELSKHYGREKFQAVKSISFDVEPGEIFGLIGPDGAGKSSIFRMLTTLLLPSSGEAWVDGCHIVKDYKAIRERVGYMPGKFSLYQDLSVEENLKFFANLFSSSLEKNYDLVKDIYVQLEPFRTRRAGKLSGGMKQKLALCCALIHRPSVLFLDEPTTGVDAVSRREFWDMLSRLKEQGITILVSTPYMDEARRCDRIALMQEGELLSINSPEQILGAFGKTLYSAWHPNMIALLKALRKSKQVKNCYAFGERHHVLLNEQADPVSLKQDLSHQGLNEVQIEIDDPNIEDCFIDLMLKRRA
ncbi:MAG TPA: ABC transporter ATP-binding protein [Bacteroidia bacterium]|nr:ABC transporter ATP-binding protein [Bacteroidia bacterium]